MTPRARVSASPVATPGIEPPDEQPPQSRVLRERVAELLLRRLGRVRRDERRGRVVPDGECHGAPRHATTRRKDTGNDVPRHRSWVDPYPWRAKFTTPSRRDSADAGRPDAVSGANARRAGSRCSSRAPDGRRAIRRVLGARIRSLPSWWPSCSATSCWRPPRSDRLLVEEIVLDYAGSSGSTSGSPNGWRPHRDGDRPVLGRQRDRGRLRHPRRARARCARHGVHAPVEDRRLRRLRRRSRVGDLPRDDAVHRPSAASRRATRGPRPDRELSLRSHRRGDRALLRARAAPDLEVRAGRLEHRDLGGRARDSPARRARAHVPRHASPDRRARGRRDRDRGDPRRLFACRVAGAAVARREAAESHDETRRRRRALRQVDRRRSARAAARARGRRHDDPLWYEVPKSRKAPKQVRRALDEGAELVFAWGGDGTVQRCVDVLAGTGHPSRSCRRGPPTSSRRTSAYRPTSRRPSGSASAGRGARSTSGG